ncbi:MAG TPA: YceD family protein, partial [Acidimicrobiales bacterium]
MPANPFVVHVARLRRVTGARWHEVRRGPIDPDHVIVGRSTADSVLPDDADVTCDVVLESFIGGIMATGTVSAPWRGACRRCAVPVDGELVIGVRERFVERPAPEDDEAYPIIDNALDLAAMARDAIVLELPMAPLCQD